MSYHSFRSRETSEIIAIVNTSAWSSGHDRKLSNQQRALMTFLKCAYKISAISKAEKETYCDAFGIVPEFDISDTAMIAINWDENYMDSIIYYEYEYD